MLSEQAGALVIKYTMEETSLSSGQAVEDGLRQRRALGLPVPGTGLTLEDFLYTALRIFHCSWAAPAAPLPGRLWRVRAAQHNEVKDAPGSWGQLRRFLGSLAGGVLAPADPRVMAVILQHLRADKAARNRAGSPPLWFLLSHGICPFPPVPSQPFGHKSARKRHFLCVWLCSSPGLTALSPW